MADFLADTYAFIEHSGGSPRYARIFRQNALATTSLNVVEIYSTLIRRGVASEEAREYARACLALVLPVPARTALRAGEFHAELRKTGVKASYIDAWGYAAAELLGRRFLTGDEAFRGLPNVEFVK